MLNNLPPWGLLGLVILVAIVLTLIMERLFPKLLKSFGYERVQSTLKAMEAGFSMVATALPDGTLPDLLAKLADTGVRAAEQMFEASQGPQKFDWVTGFMKDGLTASGYSNPEKFDKIIRGAIESAVFVLEPTNKPAVDPTPAVAATTTNIVVASAPAIAPAPAIRADDATQR